MRSAIFTAFVLGAATAIAGCGTDGTLLYLAPSTNAGASPDGAVAFDSAAGARESGGAASWQIQLSNTVDTSIDVALYEIDPFSSGDAIASLHASGRTVSCFLSAGTWEPWRDDADQFPQAVLGMAVAGYPSEKWLDIRSDTVRSLMKARLGAAQTRGCDGIQMQNLDAHMSNTGFSLTQTDVLDYTRVLSDESHRLGLSVGLSMSGDLVAAVEPLLDWGLADECLAYNECNAWLAVTAVGKRVRMIEYGSESDVSAVCPAAKQLGFDLIIKRRALDAYRVACPG